MDRELVEKMGELRKMNSLEEYKRGREEKERGDRDPQGKYVALAYNTIQIQHWCRIHDINPLNVRPINNPQDVRGVGHDLIVICFSDFGNRQDVRFRDACRLVQSRAIAWRYPEKEIPLVVHGRILGWKKNGTGDSMSDHVERTGESGQP